LVIFDLDWLVGSKEVTSYYDISSNLSVKYRGVYVEGLYSNAAKGLYELLRKADNYSSSQMSRSSASVDLKNKLYNKIVRNVNQIIRWNYELTNNINGSINGVYYNNWSIVISGNIRVDGKSLIFAKGGDIIIKWNIKKSKPDAVLTIVAISDNGTGGHIYIDNNVTNIDAVLVSEKWIFPIWAQDNNAYMVRVVKGLKNNELNNQLVIYGMVISKWNTVWGSIKIDGKYVLPGGKQIEGIPANFYRAAIYDLNYLRRYHKVFNKGQTACDPRKSSDYGTNCQKLDENKYGTYPVVIIYDPSIKVVKPYGF
jgi:hypothetical protein